MRAIIVSRTEDSILYDASSIILTLKDNGKAKVSWNPEAKSTLRTNIRKTCAVTADVSIDGLAIDSVEEIRKSVLFASFDNGYALKEREFIRITFIEFPDEEECSVSDKFTIYTSPVYV